MCPHIRSTKTIKEFHTTEYSDKTVLVSASICSHGHMVHLLGSNPYYYFTAVIVAIVNTLAQSA